MYPPRSRGGSATSEAARAESTPLRRVFRVTSLLQSPSAPRSGEQARFVLPLNYAQGYTRFNNLVRQAHNFEFGIAIALRCVDTTVSQPEHPGRSVLVPPLACRRRA